MKKIITVSLLTASLLFGATLKDINKEATGFLKSKEPLKAVELLEKQYVQGEYDNQLLFLLGTASKESGNFDKAVKYFEELLTRDKGAHRVRLDLASIYYRFGNIDKAKELLLVVKASNPPKKVGDNIDAFLVAIEQGTPKQWNISVGIGYMYDSNVNAGPTTDTVLMYNLPFTLSPDAQQNSDQAMLYQLSGSYIAQINGMSWQSSIGLNVTDYGDIDTLDAYSMSLSSGLSKQNGSVVYSLPLIMNSIKIGHVNSYYSNSVGIAPQIRYQARENLSVSASVAYQKKHYYKNSSRDGDSTTLSPSMRYFFNQSSFMDIGGYIGRERSGVETFSNTSKGLNFNYYKAFSQSLNIQLSPSYSKTGYKGEEVAFGKSRDDAMKNFRASVNYLFSDYGLNASLSYSYTKNNSNIEMYDYSREQTTLMLTKSF